jgi:hypothetical protein
MAQQQGPKARGTAQGRGARQSKGGSGRAGGPPSGRPPKGPGSRQGPRRPEPQRRDPRVIAWAAVAVVVVIVAAFVIVKVSSPSSASSPSASGLPGLGTIAPASLVRAVADVPASVTNAVGTSSETPSGLNTLKGAPALEKDGLPRVVYVGGEFCPYCATMRWALIGALGRFGHFSHLTIMYSSPDDSSGYDNVPTFSFYHSSYTSAYVSFTPYEAYNRSGGALMSVPSDVEHLISTYDTSTYVTGLSSSEDGSIPFIDVAGHYVVAGIPGWLDPKLLIGLSHQAIASALSNPSSPIAQQEDAEANYLTAGICSIDHDQPGSVCTAPGVVAAAKVLAAQHPTG